MNSHFLFSVQQIKVRIHALHYRLFEFFFPDSSGGNDLGAGAVAGIVIAMLVACVALVGAAILGRRFYLDRQPNKSSNMDSSKEFTNSNNIAYDPMNDFITDSNGYFNSSEA